MNAVIKPVQSSVDPETPCIQESTENLSDIFKSITSKKTMCKQLLKEDKPRTRLKRKLQTEERIAQESAREVVIIEDAASEGTINTVEDKYSENMEEFIDMQGVVGAIPEMFCIDEQNKLDED